MIQASTILDFLSFVTIDQMMSSVVNPSSCLQVQLICQKDYQSFVTVALQGASFKNDWMHPCWSLDRIAMIPTSIKAWML